MPLGERTRGRIKQGLNSPSSGIIFADSFETGDLSKWNTVPISGIYVTVVTTPVHDGKYAAKIWTNNISINPSLTEAFPAYYDTLCFSSFIRLTRLPTNVLSQLMRIGRWTTVPFPFFTSSIYLGVSLSGGNYYWTVNDVVTTTQVQANIWYNALLMASRQLRRIKVWINNSVLRDIPTTPLTANAVGFRIQPNNTPVDDGIYVDSVQVLSFGVT